MIPNDKAGRKRMIDLVIRGDTVVTPEGVGAHDILISGGIIAAIAERGSLAVPEGTRVIDATGKIVIPGGIDPHVHCKWHLPCPMAAQPRQRRPTSSARPRCMAAPRR